MSSEIAKPVEKKNADAAPGTVLKRVIVGTKKSEGLKFIESMTGLFFCWWGVGTLVTFIISQYVMKKEDFETYYMMTEEPNNIL